MDILGYSFFQNAILGIIIVSLISAILWVFIVLRREVQIGHTISHASFLWIVIWIILWLETSLIWMLVSVIVASIIALINRAKLINRESTMEIMSISSLSFWIFLLSFVAWVKIDIFSLLFGSILTITKFDLWLMLAFLWVVILVFSIFWRKILWVSMSNDLARVNFGKTFIYDLIFSLMVAIFVAIWVKIIWILLIWAFLVIPANIWKVLGKNFKSMMTYSLIISLFSGILGLFLSYSLDAPSWAVIVLILVSILILSILWSEIKRKS